MSTQRNDQPIPPPASPTRSLLDPPPYPVVALPDYDARSQALRVLAQWFSSLVFRRTMADGQPPDPFSITPDRVFFEQPDTVEGLQFPTIGILPGRGQYMTRGIGGAEPDDDSATVDGLALLVPYDYNELLTVEAWGSKISERRSIVAGIEVAMGTFEGTTDLRLVMKDYYGLVCTFSLMERENLEDPETQRGRRRVHLFLQMTVPVVAAARFATLDARPGGNVKIDLNMSGGGAGLADALGVTALTAGNASVGGTAGLAAMHLTRSQAETIARATLGLTIAQAAACTDDYLFELCLGLAKENASLQTWYGRPPYSPGETEAHRVIRDLPRLRLP